MLPLILPLVWLALVKCHCHFYQTGGPDIIQYWKRANRNEYSTYRIFLIGILFHLFDLSDMF